MTMTKQDVDAMRKIRNILTGWLRRWNLIDTTPAELKLSELRLKICTACPFAEEKKILEILNGSADYHKVISCRKCGCPSYQKTVVVDEKCPINKW